MAEPPLLAGAVQDRFMALSLVGVAFRLVGAPGTVPVVALSVLDTAPVPTELMADTR